jgi:soluble lytic murein transglycosylase
VLNIVKITLIILVLLLLTSCISDQVFGMPLAEFQEQYFKEGFSFLDGLQIEEEELNKLQNIYPGGNYFLGRIYEQNDQLEKAEELYSFHHQYRDSLVYWENFEALLKVNLKLTAYSKIEALTGSVLVNETPDLLDQFWFYTHRWEALRQLEKSQEAYEELITQFTDFDISYSDPSLPHGLLYYQAQLAASSDKLEDLIPAILPYLYIPRARFGHLELKERLISRFPDLEDREDSELRQILLVLDAKVDISERRYNESFLKLDQYFDNPSADFFRFVLYEPRESLLQDLYYSATQSNNEAAAILQLRDLLAKIDSNDLESQMLKIIIQEYEGRLLDQINRSREASGVFETGFLQINRILDQNLHTTGSSLSIPELYQLRERILWRWIKTLAENPNNGNSQALYRASSYIWEKDYFLDIFSEYISRLVNNQAWGELFLLLQSSGNNLPPRLVIPAIQLLKQLAETSAINVSSNALFSLENAYANSSFIYDQTLLNAPELIISKETIINSFPLTRSIALPADWLRNQEPVNNELTRNSQQVLQAYLDFHLYEDASQWIREIPLRYELNPTQILVAVTQAFQYAKWYEGLLLLETAIYKELSARKDLNGYIEAAGDERQLLSLMYPNGFAESVENFTEEYNLDPNLMLALIREESRFNPGAGSPAGALGLGQIMPTTGADIARRMRIEDFDLYNADQNIEMASFYLSYLQGRFSTHIEALAAYNGGQGRVTRWARAYSLELTKIPSYAFQMFIPIEETRIYVRRVLESYLIYTLLYSDHSNLSKPLVLTENVTPLR